MTRDNAIAPFVAAAARAVKAMPGRHDRCAWRARFTLGDARRLLDAGAPVKPADARERRVLREFRALTPTVQRALMKVFDDVIELADEK